MKFDRSGGYLEPQLMVSNNPSLPSYQIGLYIITSSDKYDALCDYELCMSIAKWMPLHQNYHEAFPLILSSRLEFG
ncbi:MAG: hypothetical protein KQI35_16415 [Bacteroidetes bacterium]|nr:hypothetical protein [Bacteroidota bacterium]